METPSTYPEVKAHLEQVIADPSTPLQVPTLEKLQVQLTASTNHTIPAALLSQIALVLPVLQEDPTPITDLGIKSSQYLSFTDVCALDPPINFIAGIKAPSPPVNLLVLSILRKAGERPSDAAVVAGNPELVVSLVELWLSTDNTTVAQATFEVLWSLLEVDHAKQNGSGANGDGSGGQGLMWRRLFGDKNVYGLLFSICSLSNVGQPDQLTKREKTIAQGRLMDMVVKIGSLNWGMLVDSHFSDIESLYSCQSLLEFAASKMVDTEDVLMHMTLINFFRDIIRVDAPGLRTQGPSPEKDHSAFSSASLDFLVYRGLHKRVIGYYVDPATLDPIDINYLAGPVMAYVSEYAQSYPNHLLGQPQSFLDQILCRIDQSFAIPSAQWAHGPVPTGDLNVLACLPRVMLVQATNRSRNPLLSISSKPVSKDVLDTLARVFHGPSGTIKSQSTDTEPQGGILTSTHSEIAAARVLYFLYLNENPNLWTNVVAAADILAMRDTALAAISFMKAVLTANWEVSPNESSTPNRFSLPTEAEISRLGPALEGTLPTSGLWAILTPPSLTIVLPFLFKAPQTYANYVGGGSGDTESAVWKVATAKYDVLVSLHAALKDTTEKLEGFEDVIRTVARRVADGPWGPRREVGSRIDALEL
ncbi:hypothetical protein FQN54_007570 [Arachnomyces sp. PD_36]|nr:hypothetical protein FQN54_007570 [Arachnomyces sp. PD_36]